MDEARLIEAARSARKNAYAPYSGYAVGAAVADEQGRIHVGANVENVSYGLTICAERAALARLVSEGGTQVIAVAVATADGGTPCGMCRQTLAEFAEDLSSIRVLCAGDDGTVRSFVLSELIPFAFESAAVERTPGRPKGST